MNKTFFLVVAAAIGLLYTQISSAAVISTVNTHNDVVIPNELQDFLFNFKYATSKDLLSSLKGLTTPQSPIANDWQLAVKFMYKYQEIVLFELINVYPSLPDSAFKVMVHNAVMSLLEDNRTDDRIVMLFEIRKTKHFNFRPYLNMFLKCNPFLALMNWVNDTDNMNAQSGSERLESTFKNNFTDTLMVINQYPEPYWASLLPETSESALNTNIVLASIEERFMKFYKLIDFASVIEFIRGIPNDSIGNKVKKTMLYSALLLAAKAEGKNGESEVFTHYFDVALSFDEFSQNSIIENSYLDILIKSVKDKYNDCYKSVMYSDNNVFMVKNEKYGEYLYTQSVIPQRLFKSKPSDISENLYTPIFSWRQQINRTIGFKWEVKHEKNLFWLKSIEFDRYMDTTRCDYIHSTNGNIALPELAIKILPDSQDTGLCRIMNVNTNQFLSVGSDDVAEDLERRTVLCGKVESSNGTSNWRFEELSFV